MVLYKNVLKPSTRNQICMYVIFNKRNIEFIHPLAIIDIPHGISSKKFSYFRSLYSTCSVTHTCVVQFFLNRCYPSNYVYYFR